MVHNHIHVVWWQSSTAKRDCMFVFLQITRKTSLVSLFGLFILALAFAFAEAFVCIALSYTEGIKVDIWLWLLDELFVLHQACTLLFLKYLKLKGIDISWLSFIMQPHKHIHIHHCFWIIIAIGKILKYKLCVSWKNLDAKAIKSSNPILEWHFFSLFEI